MENLTNDISGVAFLVTPTLMLGALYLAALISWVWDEFHHTRTF